MATKRLFLRYESELQDAFVLHAQMPVGAVALAGFTCVMAVGGWCVSRVG